MNSEYPLVSMITPAYNTSEFLDALIQSVLGQTYRNIEYIVIDDGSVDDGKTVEILRKYPTLVCWSRENKGQYFTVNEGLRRARGEIVCIISADDRLKPEAVAEAVKFLVRHPSYDGVYGKTAYIDSKGRPIPNRYPYVINFFPVSAYLHWQPFVPKIEHCSLYLRKAVIEKHQLFFDLNYRYTSDLDWIIRMRQKGLRMKGLNLELSEYRHHDRQLSKINHGIMVEEHKLILKVNNINWLSYKIHIAIYAVYLVVAKSGYVLWRWGPRVTLQYFLRKMKILVGKSIIHFTKK